MYIKIKKKWQTAFDFVMILLGTICMGFAFSIFLEPNNISTGGFSGLSMVINTIFNLMGIMFLNTSIIYFVLNVGLFLYALKTLGKKFAIKAFAGILFFSLSMELCSYIPLNLTFEPLISALYGGILMGVGVGIVVRFGGSTGGGDMIASIVRSKKPKASIGSVIIIIDAIVVLLSLFVFNNGLEVMPYTIIALAISSVCTDFVNDGYKQVRAYHIITDNGVKIASRLMREMSRGCTLTKAEGMHTRQQKDYLVCLVSKFQTASLVKIVKEEDENAFMYSTSVKEVIGFWTSTEEINNEILELNSDDKKPTKKDKKANSKDIEKASEKDVKLTNTNIHKEDNTKEITTKDNNKQSK